MEYPFKSLMPLDEATARTGYYRDWSHIDADTFHQISELVKFIREKGYGADTREAIAQALERVYHDAMKSGNADMELSMARKHFKDLASRLDASDDKLTSAAAQLAHNAGKLNNKVGDGVKAEPEDLSQRSLDLLNGGTVVINSIPQNASVDGIKLTSRYNYKQTLGAGDTLNITLDSGSYLVNTGILGYPDGLLGSSVLEVTGISTRFSKQTLTPLSYNNGQYVRVLDANNPSTSRWENTSKLPNPKYLTSSDNLDDYVKFGRWLAINPIGIASTKTFAFEVDTFTTNSTPGGSYWGTQTLTSVDLSSYEKYERVFYYNGTVYSFGTFKRIDNTFESGDLPLIGKTVVNLADSIFGNTSGPNSVSAAIASKTGATVLNMGFGGSRVAMHAPHWDAFSLYRLVDEIVKDDSDPTKWALQDIAIQAHKDGVVTLGGFPSYFEQRLNDLKLINFNIIEYLTIAGGTNDFTASVLLANALNPLDTTTFSGALRYSLSKLMSKYKHLKILVCTPMYRFWRDAGGAFIDDSDTRAFGGQTLIDFVDTAIDVSREFKTPVTDNYRDLGINKHNKELYFPSNDSTHPNVTGNKKLGSLIGSGLINKF